MTRPPVGPAFSGTLPDNLEILKSHRRWLVWRWTLKDGKWTKVPCQPKPPSSGASVNDPSHWALYDDALAAFNRGGFDGVGFVLNGKKIAAFDLDKCVSRGPDGEIILTPRARKLVERCGSYCELTPSGNGLRIIGLSRGGSSVQVNFPVEDQPNWKLEVYRNTARYITVTGVPLDGYDLFPACIDERIEEALRSAPPTLKVDSALANAAFTPGDFSGCDDLEDAVDHDVLEIIRNGASLGDRSEVFHGVIFKLFAAGFDQGQILDLLKRHPRGIAGKYARRLEKEVRRSWDKAGASAAREADSQNVEILPASCDGNVVVVAVNAVEAQAISEATGYETRYAVDVGVVRPEAGKRFVYALVNGRNANPTHARKQREKIRQWTQEGLIALEATPFNRDRRNAGWADLLHEQGPEALKDRLDLWAVEHVHVEEPVPSLDDARRKQGTRMDAFREAALTWNPQEPAPRHICGMDVGGGKSFAAQDCAIDLVLALRKQGRKETITDFKPNHKLIGEQAEEYREKAAQHGVTVEVYKGPSAKIDPLDPSDDAPRMCARHKEVEEAEKLAVYRDELCHRCPHSPKNGGACAYLSQTRGDINLAPHVVAFQTKLPELLSKDGVPAIILDEGFYGAARTEPVEIRLDDVEGWRLPQDTEDKLELADMRHRLVTALRDAPLGWLQRKTLFKAGSEVTHERALEALGLEKSRRMTEADEPNWRKRTPNKSLHKAAPLWSAIIDYAAIPFGDRRNTWAVEITENNEGERVARVSGRRYLSDKIGNVPTLVIDATHTPHLVREVLPRADDKGTISIAAPHRTVRQYINRTYSLDYLAPYRKSEVGKKRKPEAEAKEVERARRAEVHRFKTRALIQRRCLELGGERLIVCNKCVAESPEFQNLPKGVHVAWFGDVAGRNAWGNVRLVVTIGRWPMTPSAAETSAAALAGRPVKRLTNEDGNLAWYRREMGYRLVRDGDRTLRVPAELDAHPDPVAEALRVRSFVGEIDQALGRARAVKRTANDPVEFMVLGNTPLPMRVDEIISDAEIEVTPTDLMLADGGIAFEGPAAAYAVYGADRRDRRRPLWPTIDACKVALQRTNKGTFPYRESLIGKCPSVRFQRKAEYSGKIGRGHKPQLALVDLCVRTDPRAAIEAVLGPLAVFEIQTPDMQPVAAKQVVEQAPQTVGRIFRVTISESIFIRSDLAQPFALAPVGGSQRKKRRGRKPAKTPALPESFWPSICERQIEMGWTRGDVAQYCGMSQSQLAKAEKGRVTPPASVVERLMSFLSETPPSPSGNTLGGHHG